MVHKKRPASVARTRRLQKQHEEQMSMTTATPKGKSDSIPAERTIFTTSREMEFFSEKELNMQIGCSRSGWPLALLKELIDNSLDACETAGVLPEITVVIGENSFTVIDNGPGLPKAALSKSLDYFVRVSDKAYYVSPTRGQLGNALKCVWAAPFVVDGQRGRIDVSANGQTHVVEVALDQIGRKPNLQLTTRPSDIKTGTSIQVHWPGLSSYRRCVGGWSFYEDATLLVANYALLNPRATFAVRGPGPDSTHTTRRLGAHWMKWSPNEPTSAWWYGPDQMADLIRAEVAEGRNGGRRKTVRQFIAGFAGLSSVIKQKCVFQDARLPGETLEDLVNGSDVDLAAVERLLNAMQSASRVIQPKKLGALDLSLHVRLAQMAGVDTHLPDDGDEKKYLKTILEKVRYKKASGFVGELPFVVEAAFVVDAEAEDTADDELRLHVTCGINWSPALPGIIPFPDLQWILGEQRVDSHDPVILIVHVAHPLMRATDRGKSRYSLPELINDALKTCVRFVTSRWKAAKLKRERVSKEERQRMVRAENADRKTLLAAAYEVMERAYMVVSDNGMLPANARQIMYVARPLIIELAGSFWKNSASFTQKALPDFIAGHPDQTKDWDVVFDARGHFIEPHTGHSFGLGTVEVRDYIGSWNSSADGDLDEISIDLNYPTRGPANRYKFAVFIEKEGFDALLRRARIAERYDLAIFSTKGMSVTSARRLVEELSRNGVTILVLHDFDLSGLGIYHTIRNNTRRYTFQDRPNVISLGLRLEDAKDMCLASEAVEYGKRKKDPRKLLVKYGGTQEERDFLVNTRGFPWKGQRVELNAMTSRQFIEYLERKLVDAGVKKVVPGEEVLAEAYKRAQQRHLVQQAIDEAIEEVAEQDIVIPADLDEQVRKRLEENPSLSWDEAVAQIVRGEDA
jgi:hypothetical protein